MRTQYRAKRPALPEPTRGLERTREEFRLYRIGRETTERRSVVRGLILLAVLVLVGSIVHAGFDRTFVHGWWRP